MAQVDKKSALEESVLAIKRGDNSRALRLLGSIVEQEPRNEVAWLLLAKVVDKPEQAIDCLQNVLAINPQNTVAQQRLEAARQAVSRSANEPLSQFQPIIVDKSLRRPVGESEMGAAEGLHPADDPLTSRRTAASDLISLTCPTCGGRLQVTQDMERFACGYCGTEHVVRRSGGTVSLKPVMTKLTEVQTGVDRTLSELSHVRSVVDRTKYEFAIMRLRDEIVDLERRKRKLKSSGNVRPYISSSLLAIGAIVVGYAGNWSSVSTTGWIVLSIAIIPVLVMGLSQASVNRDMAKKKRELDALYRLASG